jgi:hypothetical protein
MTAVTPAVMQAGLAAGRRLRASPRRWSTPSRWLPLHLWRRTSPGRAGGVRQPGRLHSANIPPQPQRQLRLGSRCKSAPLKEVSEFWHPTGLLRADDGLDALDDGRDGKERAPPSLTPGYPRLVAIARLRGRMPLVVFILLALVCLGVLGFACACLSEQPAAALERAMQSPTLAPAVVELWPAIVFGVFGAALLVYSPVEARGRVSPQLLQRFLF